MNISIHKRTVSAFHNAFGTIPSFVVQAPGRVNLIGEHTDYNAGFVLPCAIGYRTLVAASPRSDRLINVVAVDYGNQKDSFNIDAPIARRVDANWANYVRGMAVSFMEQGWPLQGANLAIAGDVPQGAGLSSSASLEISVGHAFKALQGLEQLDSTALALLAQWAENYFVGCNCGIMDQLISSHAAAGCAVLIDCRSLLTKLVAIPNGMVVLILHSRVSRGLIESQYNTRREQCEAAARHYGVSALRDLNLTELLKGSSGLNSLIFRRARHVVTENQRTLEAADALERQDLIRMGELMAQSHISMRDDFEISVPAIDHLVEIVSDAIGARGGARMTGGGFGGCVVALLPDHKVDAVLKVVQERYKSPEGKQALFFVTEASDGAGIVVDKNNDLSPET